MTPKFTHSSENDGLIVTGEIFDTPLAKSDVAIIYARISIHNKDNNHLINTFYVPSITEEHMVATRGQAYLEYQKKTAPFIPGLRWPS